MVRNEFVHAQEKPTYDMMNKELHDRLSKKNAKRDKKGRFIKK